MTTSEKANESFHLEKFVACVNEKCGGYGFSAECQTIQATGNCKHTKKTDDPARRQLLADQ